MVSDYYKDLRYVEIIQRIFLLCAYAVIVSDSTCLPPGAQCENISDTRQRRAVPTPPPRLFRLLRIDIPLQV